MSVFQQERSHYTGGRIIHQSELAQRPSSEWQALDEEYGSAADGITYDIHCGGTQLLVHADAERPVVVNNVIQQLETFWQQAEPIN
jgi:hypothetical protein